MGTGYTKKCPKCGFEFHSSTGVGFMFPQVYAEAVQKAKEGVLGEEIQNFFNEHKDGALNAEFVTLCCEKCGNLSNDMDLTMYIPSAKKPAKINHGRWSVAFEFEGADYVDWTDLEKYYDEYAKYPHKCEKCGGPMRCISENEVEDEDLLCPECKAPLETVGEVWWD